MAVAGLRGGGVRRQRAACTTRRRATVSHRPKLVHAWSISLELQFTIPGFGGIDRPDRALKPGQFPWNRSSQFTIPGFGGIDQALTETPTL